MDVLIHTSGRSDLKLQNTLRELLNDGVVPTLVVQAREETAYRSMLAANDLEHVPVHVLPGTINTLAHTRDYIIHEMPGSDHVVFMDDDLTFAVRREDDPTKFRMQRPRDLQGMIAQIDAELAFTPMAGIGAREGGNRVTQPFVYNTRIMRVLAFRRSYLKEKNLFFQPMVVMEDFHINLQILRSNADTVVCNNWVSNQMGGSDAPGGCSVYRTDDVQTKAAHMLASFHPGFVNVVTKTTKTAWGGKSRTDVIVQWKKARESSRKRLPAVGS